MEETGVPGGNHRPTASNLKRGSLSNVNSMGDCDGAIQSERQRLFPLIAFDLANMVSLQD